MLDQVLSPVLAVQWYCKSVPEFLEATLLLGVTCNEGAWAQKEPLVAAFMTDHGGPRQTMTDHGRPCMPRPFRTE